MGASGLTSIDKGPGGSDPSDLDPTILVGSGRRLAARRACWLGSALPRAARRAALGRAGGGARRRTAAGPPELGGTALRASVRLGKRAGRESSLGRV